MDIIEHRGVTPLIALIDEINRGERGKWIIACIKKEYLKIITNEAFLLVVRPALQNAETVHIYFASGKHIYIAWNGELKSVFKQLRGVVAAILVQPGSTVEPSTIISYIDPYTDNADLKATLKEEATASEKHVTVLEKKKTSGRGLENDPLGWDDDEDDNNQGDMDNLSPSLTATPEQISQFMSIKSQRSFRKQINILVVEDQFFSQKLLCDIIRGAKMTGFDSPVVDTAEGLDGAWGIFLKKAHDIVFIDLGLRDGSGHTLTRAIKELDPATLTIIVTANNYEEELNVAQQNNADGFIAKPYNKQQILNCIEKFISTAKGRGKGGVSHGSASQLR